MEPAVSPTVPPTAVQPTDAQPATTATVQPTIQPADVQPVVQQPIKTKSQLSAACEQLKFDIKSVVRDTILFQTNYEKVKGNVQAFKMQLDIFKEAALSSVSHDAYEMFIKTVNFDNCRKRVVANLDNVSRVMTGEPVYLRSLTCQVRKPKINDVSTLIDKLYLAIPDADESDVEFKQLAIKLNTKLDEFHQAVVTWEASLVNIAEEYSRYLTTNLDNLCDNYEYRLRLMGRKYDVTTCTLNEHVKFEYPTNLEDFIRKAAQELCKPIIQ